MNKSKFMKNILFGFGGQLVIIILGIIIPRVMITSYGSDVNGLISTITQIFTYMALMEAGIGQAAKNALYKPVAEENKKEISHIVSIAQRDYRKITGYYGIGVVALSLLVPVLIKSEVDHITIFLIVLFEGMSGVITFYHIETQTTILSVDGRGYVNNAINVINKTISYIVKIVMAALGINIVFLQFVYFLITIAKVIFYKIYFMKHYPWIDYTNSQKNKKLENKKSFILTEIAWTIFSSTDMVVLSMFVSTQLSSVYAVYNMIFINLHLLLNAVFHSVSYILGQMYYTDRKNYASVHDMFTSVFLGGITILMSIAYILSIPFVRLYTKGVTDINYIYPVLPILFALVQILSWSRYVSANLTSVVGYAKEVSRVSILEAITNLTLSIMLVKKMSITGVLLATVIALPMKVIYCTYLSDKKILNRSYKKSFCILGVNYLFFGITIFLGKLIELKISNYVEFFILGVVISTAWSVIGIGINMVVNPDCIKIIKILKRR